MFRLLAQHVNASNNQQLLKLFTMQAKKCICLMYFTERLFLIELQ